MHLQVQGQAPGTMEREVLQFLSDYGHIYSIEEQCKRYFSKAGGVSHVRNTRLFYTAKCCQGSLFSKLQASTSQNLMAVHKIILLVDVAELLEEHGNFKTDV